MNGGSCSLYIEGKGKVSVSIGGSPSMPSISFTGLHGHGAVGYNPAGVCETAARRGARRRAGTLRREAGRSGFGRGDG